MSDASATAADTTADDASRWTTDVDHTRLSAQLLIYSAANRSDLNDDLRVGFIDKVFAA